MDKKPRKSKAFIITFILVIILLLVGYWLFSNKDKIFGTGEINLGKIFEPLLGTSDRVGLDVITDKRGGTNQGTSRVIVPSEGGEVIPQNGIVYAIGANENGNPVVLNYDEIRDGSRGIIPFGIAVNGINNTKIGDVVVVNKILAEGGENIPLNGLVYTTGTNSDGNPIVFNYVEERDRPLGIVPFGLAIEDISIGNLGSVIIVNNQFVVEGGEYIPNNSLVYVVGANENGNLIVRNYNEERDRPLGITPLGVSTENINPGSLGEVTIIDTSAGSNLWERTSGFFSGLIGSIFGRDETEVTNPSVITDDDSRIVIPSEGGTYIPNNSIVYIVGVNENGDPIVWVYDESTDGVRGLIPFGISIENINNGEIGDVVVINRVLVEGGEDIPINGVVYTTGNNANGDPIVFNYVESRDKPLGIVPYGIALEDISGGELGYVVIINNQILVEGGEYIPDNGLVYLFGVNENGYPIVLNYDEARDRPLGIEPFGISIGSINPGEIGEIILIDSERITPTPNYTCRIGGEVVDCSSVVGLDCTRDGVVVNCSPLIDVNGECLNDATNPPMCTTLADGTCVNDATNPPLCTTLSNNTCANGATNYPLCTTLSDGECANGATNPPMCTTLPGGECLNGATNPPLCTTLSNNTCANGATNYPLCTTLSDGECANGASNPPLCTTLPNSECANGATNYPLCTTLPNGECANGMTNPPLCTTTTERTYACSDGEDNDGDGLIDEADSGCYTNGDSSIEEDYDPEDNSEWNVLPTPDEGDDDDDEEITKNQCEDDIDNDSDNLVDENDPGCHTDFDTSNDTSYDPTLNNESLDSLVGIEPNQCRVFDDYPLEFTDSERAQLAELLRKFYLIAPTLKVEDDISLVYSEIDRYRTFVAQLSGLINQCYAQTSSVSYTGPKTRYGNPWFKQFDRGSYITSGNITEKTLIWLSLWKAAKHDGRSMNINESDFETLLNIW